MPEVSSATGTCENAVAARLVTGHTWRLFRLSNSDPGRLVSGGGAGGVARLTYCIFFSAGGILGTHGTIFDLWVVSCFSNSTLEDGEAAIDRRVLLKIASSAMDGHNF